MIPFPHILLFFVLTACTQNNFVDTPSGVKVIYDYSDNIYPEHWLKGDIAGTGQSLKSSEYDRSKIIITKALRKYPNTVLSKNLTHVYVLNQIHFFGVNYGGTYYESKLYIANSGVDDGYTDEYVEKTFHHEFSSILLENFSSYFDKTAWKNANDPSFSYGTGGIDAVTSHNDDQNFNETYLQNGILNQYGSSALEEDFNTYCENIFMDNSEFWDAVKKYPRVRSKAKLAMNFYKKINIDFKFQQIE